MKKNFLFAMTAVALLSGCSNNLDEPVDDNYPGLDAEGNAPVEVTLGTNAGSLDAAVTRAAVTPVDWTGKTVGILALAKNMGADFTTPAGRLVNTTGTIGANPDYSVTFTGGQKLYYPLGNDYNYSFYGYYPTTVNGNPVTPALTASNVKCSYTLDGTQDLLVARAAADVPLVVDQISYEGYNARYFRKGGVLPTLQFQHLLTRLTFNIVAGKDENLSSDAAKKILVNSISIVGVKDQATLTFPIVKGQELNSVTFGASTVDFTLKETNGNAANPVNPADPDVDTKVGVMMGDGIMLQAGQSSYQMVIEVQDEAGNVVTSALTITIPVADGTAKAGTAYRVNMTIYGLKDIQLKTSVAAWKTGDDVNLEL